MFGIDLVRTEMIYPLIQSDLSQSVHNCLDINSLRASDRTLEAACADPDSFTLNNLLFLSELGEADDSARENIHFLRKRTAG